MNKEIKIVAGVGLAAGTVVGAYAISKRPIKVDERSKENMFDKKEKSFEEMLVGEEMEGLVATSYCQAGDYTADNCLSEKAVRTVAPDDIASHKMFYSLSPIEKEKIKNMVTGMSEEEMKITLQNIPMTLIFDHITGVLEKNRQFAQSVQDAMNRLQE